MEVKVDIKIPSQREHKKLFWKVRDLKKFEMIQATKKAMALQDKIHKASCLLIEVGGSIRPEHCYISPIVNLLREEGWLDDGYTVTVRVTKDLKGMKICL